MVKTLSSFFFDKWNCLLFFIVVLVRVSFFINLGMAEWPDTGSYVDWSFANSRMPLYPAVIDVCQWILQEKFSKGIFVAQALTSLLSAVYMYEAAFMIIKRYASLVSGRWNVIISRSFFLIYALNPCIFVWDTNILTESFSISASVFFVYYALKWLDEIDVKNGILTAVWSFIATMVRPANLILAIDLFVLMALLAATKKGSIRRLMPAAIVYTASIIFYLGWSIADYQIGGCLGYLL